MKKLLLALALLLAPSAALAQCNGVFPNNTACGNVSGQSNTPRAIPLNSFPANAPGGTTGQIQYNAGSGLFGGFTASGGATINTTTGVVILAPITGTSTVTGATSTYTSTQNNTVVNRSNSGAAMSDTLPGTSPGILPANTTITITNADTAGVLAIGVGSGAAFKTVVATTGFVYLCPGQTTSFYTDGANYWQINLPGRCKLSAATTVFASVAGSGNGNGLTSGNSIAGIQALWNFAVNTFDLAGFTFTMQLADGTYNTAVGIYFTSPFVGQTNVGDFANPCCATFNKSTNVILQGNNTTPDNVLVNNTNGATNNFGVFLVTNGAALFISGMHVVAGAQGAYDFFIGSNGFAQITNVDFGQCLEGQVSVFPGGTVFMSAPYTISGSCAAHVIAGGQGAFVAFLAISGGQVTVNAPLTFSTAFAVAQSGAINALTATVFNLVGGVVTGPKYSSFLNGVISVSASTCGSGTFFPGTSNGSCSTGGQYQ